MTARPSVLAYARLLRIPNVFTAIADIGLGLFAARGTIPCLAAILLIAASSLLYCGGMVWNDVFDVEQDRRERPFRPLPSGAITRRIAAVLGGALLLVGWLLAAFAGWQTGEFSPTPAVIAALLVVMILAYDRWLKRTAVGPVGMGACRFLNVLLGCSLAAPDVVPWGLRLHLAAVVAVYIVGVTLFAQTEARRSDAGRLRLAATISGCGLAFALALPMHLPEGGSSVLFPYLLVAVAFVVGIPAAQAWIKPEPSRVQFAVKRAVLGLIAIDAVLATAVGGTAGLLLLALLPPAVLIGKCVYST